MSSNPVERRAPTTVTFPDTPQGKAVADLLRHLRVRRHVYFCVVYRPAIHITALDTGGYDEALKTLDEGLFYAESVGLLPRYWQVSPPTVTAEDNGGFTPSFLREYLKADDQKALGL
jgi:hypothetical protein